MRTLTVLCMLAASAHAAAQMPREALHTDAQQALRAHLANRVSSRIAVVPVDDALTSSVKDVRDREVLDRIETEFDQLLQGRPLTPGIALTEGQLQRFEQQV